MRKIKFEGDLRSIKPARLIDSTTNDKIEDFFLVLGLLYNDLKNLSFHLIQVDNFFDSIDKEKKSIEAGESGGMKSHLVRIIMATFFEFIEFVRKNKEIFNTGEFKILYEKLNSRAQSFWDDIIDIANDREDPDKSDIIKIIRYVRHNFGFHYYQSAKTLKEGFRDFFFNDPIAENNDAAYYYTGDTMEQTRFFYCDAAAQRSLANAVTHETKMTVDDFNKKILKMLEDTNFAIMFLMKIYIKQRPF